jgi:SpoVK/Ycf46/Vps4 family AAA+-type ATPase
LYEIHKKASAVLHRILERERIKSSISRIISVKELILQASSSMNLEELMKYIAQQTIISERSGRAILIIDDLDLVIDSADDSSIHNEKRIVLNSISRTIDNLNSKQKGHKIDRDVPPIIIGICCSEKLDPQSDLIRIGRFEKTLVMSPPSEIQRCQILKEMFQQLPVSDERSGTKEEICHTWSIGVGPHTAGCVAADLKRLCTDALTRSNTRKEMKKNVQCDGSIVWADIREAARMCIPSQLAQLDVTLTGNIAGNDEERLKGLTPKERFFRIWDDKFIGYREIKSKIFRTIYWPWMRHNSDTKWSNTVSALEREVPPSSGVLFHGKSGTGKTYAAECLANSLGLHVVRVSSNYAFNYPHMVEYF